MRQTETDKQTCGLFLIHPRNKAGENASSVQALQKVQQYIQIYAVGIHKVQTSASSPELCVSNTQGTTLNMYAIDIHASHQFKMVAGMCFSCTWDQNCTLYRHSTECVAYTIHSSGVWEWIP